MHNTQQNETTSSQQYMPPPLAGVSTKQVPLYFADSAAALEQQLTELMVAGLQHTWDISTKSSSRLFFFSSMFHC